MAIRNALLTLLPGVGNLVIVEPEWTERAEKRGLDPLGMQNAGVALYQALLPGISNVTLRMRYYGYYCWVSDAYAKSGATDKFTAWQSWVRRAEALYALVSSLATGQNGVADEADGIAARVQELADNDGVSLSEIAILVSKQQQLYCQKLIAAFDARGVAYREEDVTQNLASEPAARLIVDFLLVTSSPRQPAAHRRLLDLIVFNQGLDEEREYQLRSKWNRLLGETRKAIATCTIDLSHKPDLEKLVETLLDAVGSEAIVAMSSAYAQGDMLATCIVETVNRAHELLSGGADPATALSSFSGDRAVRIMSIHKSKGLEFDTVFMLGVEEETFWGKQADERSAFFVGISRAKLRLFLTVCEERSRPAGAGRWTVARRPHEEFLSYV